MHRLKRVGKIKPKNSLSVPSSKLGVGFEKLDRGVFDPEKAYDKVAELGCKWVRIQSGWARTETQKGVYDFEWLDSIVNNLVSRGLSPWICLCYGNGLYDDEAAKVFGAVGSPPIHSSEAENAWKRYVEALVGKFSDRVALWEIWNEPDGPWCWKHGVSGEEYGRFAVTTSQIIKSACPSAKIAGGAICYRDLHFLNAALDVGMADAVDYITFHEYTPDENMVYERVSALRGLAGRYNPRLKIIQGESGSQSKYGGAGALSGGNWTERRQAKQLIRHTVADLLCDVVFSSYFSTMDMIEALNGTVDDKSSYMDYAYFGLLGADFDSEGKSTGEYTPKPSYYAMQNICSLFAGDVCSEDVAAIMLPEHSDLIFGCDCTDASIKRGGFRLDDGSLAYVYWNSTDLMTTEFESTVTLEIAAEKKNITLVDLYDGGIYEFPNEMCEDMGHGCVKLKNIPIKDYPLVIVIRG